jgi:hypothetical protein
MGRIRSLSGNLACTRRVSFFSAPNILFNVFPAGSPLFLVFVSHGIRVEALAKEFSEYGS